MAILLALLATTMATLFTNEPGIVKITTSYLLIVPISYGLYGLVMSVNAMFNSIGKPLPGVFISTLRVFVLQLPLVYIAAQFYSLEIAFMFISISNIIAGIVGYFWIKTALSELKTL